MTFHYTYKVTFEEIPHYYYGLHSTENLDDGYQGSPKTNRRYWDIYTPIVTILEFHETRELALGVETRLIKPFLNEENCLNEHYGAVFSVEASKKGNSAQPIEVKKANGRKAAEYGMLNKVGAHGRSKEEIRETAKENFARQTLEQKRSNAAKQHCQRWRCLVTDYVSTPGPLSRYQNSRGIDTSLRIRII